MSWPRWAETAFRELLMDVREIGGSAHSPRVLEYHATTGLHATNDETPWCASFVGACLKWSGIPPTGSARARSYTEWGMPESMETPRLGSVVVFSRGPSGLLPPAPGVTDTRPGHVGFFVGRYGPAIQVLGGNQGNRVSIRPYPEDRLIGFRWPRPDDGALLGG